MQKRVRKSDDIVLVLSEEEELFRHKFFLNDSDLPLIGSQESLRCTICSKTTYGKIYPHPALKVIVCFDCLNNYEKHEYLSYHNYDDIMCRWCTKSSLNYNCSTCTCLFCSECLDRNFGPNYVRDNWECFICNPKQLWRLRAICTRAMDDRPRNKSIKSIKINVDLDKNQLPQTTTNDLVSPRNDKMMDSDTTVPQKGATDTCDMMLNVKKDVDFFIHSFKTGFDTFYDRYSKLECNETYEYVQRNNEKLSKFFDSAIENLEYVKSRNNMSFCAWQSKHLEHLPVVNKRRLSECSKKSTLKSNAISFAKRKSDDLSDSSVCPLKKTKKTENDSYSLESQDTVNREHHSESSDDSLDLLTQTNLSILRMKKNNSANLQDAQNKQLLDENDISSVQSLESLNAIELKSNNNKSEEGSVHNSQIKSQECDNIRSNQILDLITSNQFEGLQNIDSQEKQTSTELQNPQTKSNENQNLQSSNQNSQSNLTKLEEYPQLSKVVDSQNQTVMKTSNLATESQDDSYSIESSLALPKSRLSQSYIHSPNGSDLLQPSEIKVELDEFDNNSTDTIILNEIEDYDSIITIQQILCEKTGTFYQSFSVGKDQIHLMNGNETDSENATEPEEYADIIKEVLKQGGYTSDADKEEVGETNEISHINDEGKNVKVKPENMKDENSSGIQIKPTHNLDDLQNTEDYQIALQQERFAETQVELPEPEQQQIAEASQNVGTDSNSQETTPGTNSEQVWTDLDIDADYKSDQDETNQEQVDQDLADEIHLKQNEADLGQMDQAQLDQNQNNHGVIDLDGTENEKKFDIAMAELIIDEIKLEKLSQEIIILNRKSTDKEAPANQSTDTDPLESDIFELNFEESETGSSDGEKREEAYNSLYHNIYSDECNDLSLSDSLSSSSIHSLQSKMSEIEIVLDPRQITYDSDTSSTDSPTEKNTISAQIKVDPKLQQQCRIQLIKSKEDLQIERLINLKTLNKTIRSRNSSSDGSVIVKKKRKKVRTNKIEDDNDTTSLTSDCAMSDDPESTHNVSNAGSINYSPIPQADSANDSDDESSHDLLADKSVVKPKKATHITNKSNAPNDDEIDKDDPDNKWRRDKLLTGALNDNDSDSTNDSVADALLERYAAKKHRKRKSSTCDSDSKVQNLIEIDDTESDTQSDDSDVQFILPKNKSKGRHNIREVIPDSLLQAETQQADKEEAERRKRIDQKNKSLEVVLSQSSFNKDQPQLVLDWDNALKEPLVSVDPLLVPILKTHQINGIKFMWDNCFESVARIKDSRGAGCILAHCMGLGKTMQVIVLAHTILTHSVTNVKHILVLCPLTTVFNWCNEFKKTLKDVSEKLMIYFITPDRFKSFSRKVTEIRRWRKTGGVLIISYDTFKSVIHAKRNVLQSSTFLKEALLSPGPDLVVCDEGHILKSGKTNIFMSLKEVKAARRIILTGTPMQNNLKEYYYMVNFVKPSLLGTFKEYSRCFINPIENGQFEDSSKADINLMRKRSHVLHKKLETTVQRFEVSELKPYLPKKNDYVLFLQLSETQIELYNLYLKLRDISIKKMLFQDFHNLLNVWTHPAMLQLKLEKKEKDEKLRANNDSTTKKDLTKDDITFPKDLEADSSTAVPFDWFKGHVPDDLMTNLAHGPKMVLLFSIIRECEFIGEKLLVFSSSIIELDLIEHFLKDTQMIEGQCWRKGQNYLRMDGAVLSDDRSHYCDLFNNKHKKIKLFLVSHKVGGLGLNLVAASRVVLMDVSWNPAYDSQAVFRVYRFGQERECHIYRLVAMGTMEEAVYSRAVTKLAISCRVVDEQQISRHFKSDELQRMYKLDLDFLKKRPTPTLPPDRLLAKLWITHTKILHNFCDHEALLQNQTHEELNEEEMKMAWDEYNQEEEKARERARAMLEPFSSTSGLANNMVNGNPLLPCIPIRPNIPTNFPFRNNHAQNISTTNANYNYANQPKTYDIPKINQPLSSNAQQFQHNNPQQNIPNATYTNPSMCYRQPGPSTSRYKNVYDSTNKQLPANYGNTNYQKVCDISNLQNSMPTQNLSGSAKFSHINPAKHHNNLTSSSLGSNSQFTHGKTHNTSMSSGNLNPNNNYKIANKRLNQNNTKKMENIRTRPAYSYDPIYDSMHRYKKPETSSNSTKLTEQNANDVPKKPAQTNSIDFHDKLKQILSNSKPAIKNGDHRATAVPSDEIFEKALRKNGVSLSVLIDDEPEPTINAIDRQISYLSETRRIQTGDGEIQVRRIIQDPDNDIVEI